MEDFNEILAAEKGIVVIKFYASFCRACKTMAPKFRQLASHHDQEAMTFAQIELLVSMTSISHSFRSFPPFALPPPPNAVYIHEPKTTSKQGPL